MTKQMTDMEVTDFTVNGKCSDCGSCCSDFLPLSKSEVKRIKAYIKKHHIKEQRHNMQIGYDITCPFRDDLNKGCTIYEVRPEICRAFRCDKPIEQLIKIKQKNHAEKTIICMRNKFYGSEEDIELLKMMLGCEK